MHSAHLCTAGPSLYGLHLQVVDTLKAENYNCMLAKTDPYTHGVLRNADLEVQRPVDHETWCGLLVGVRTVGLAEVLRLRAF